MPYHKGAGSKKSGPKGPWKAQGKVLEAIMQLDQEKPWISGEQMSRIVESKTGTRLTSQRINQIRHGIGGKRYAQRKRTAAK